MVPKRLDDDGLYLRSTDPRSGDSEPKRLGPAPRLRPPDEENPAVHEDDVILFAIRAQECPTSGVLATQPTPGSVELILVHDGVPLKATLDAEQAVGLGLALLVANRGELDAWTRDDPDWQSRLPEAS